LALKKRILVWLERRTSVHLNWEEVDHRQAFRHSLLSALQKSSLKWLKRRDGCSSQLE